MVRNYCDFCKTEITDDNRASGGSIYSPTRLGTTLRRGGHVLKVEIITGMDGVANQGDVCRHCILDALKRLDTRPEAAKRGAPTR